MTDASDELEPLYPIDGAFTDLFRASKSPPEFIIENLLPIGLTILGGAPKSNKSTLAMIMASIVAGYRCACLPPDLMKATRNGPVMVFSAEATAGELRSMVEDGLGVTGQPDEGIIVSDNPWSFMLDDPSGHHQLMEWLEKRDPLLTIIDPFVDFHTLDEKDAGEMIKIVKPIRQWAADHKRAVILVHHARKPGNGDGDEKNLKPEDMRGSSAIYGKADGIILITHKEKDKSHHIYTKFKRGGGWERDLRLPIYDRVGEPAGEVFTAVELMILEGIRNLGLNSTPKQISEQLKVQGGTFATAIAKLFRNGLIKKHTNGVNWIANK